MKARLYNKYVNEVVPVLKEKHKYTNVHQIPRMVKIVVNMGVSASLEKTAVEDAAKDLAADNIREIARALFRQYALAFEAVGVLLLTAVVAVMVMAKRKLES